MTSKGSSMHYTLCLHSTDQQVTEISYNRYIKLK